MYATVVAFFYKMGMVHKGVFVSVFQDEIPFRMQDVGGENKVRKVFQPFQGVRRVGKDDIELFPADGKEIEDIVPHHGHVPEAQPVGLRLDERGVFAGHLHTINPGSAPGGEFEGDGTGAPEKVQDLEVLELVFVVEDIEKALLGEVRGGTRLVARRRQDDFPLAFSPDDSHSCTTPLK